MPTVLIGNTYKEITSPTHPKIHPQFSTQISLHISHFPHKSPLFFPIFVTFNNFSPKFSPLLLNQISYYLQKLPIIISLHFISHTPLTHFTHAQHILAANYYPNYQYYIHLRSLTTPIRYCHRYFFKNCYKKIKKFFIFLLT